DRDALVHGAVGEAVELGLADLEQVVAAAGDDVDDLARAVVGLEPGGEVDDLDGDACAQRLEHGVAARDDLLRGPAALGSAAARRAAAPGRAVVARFSSATLRLCAAW